MTKQLIILTLSVLTLTIGGLQVIHAQESSSTGEAKSVGWYVANLQEARNKNQQCHDNPSLKTSADCANALHALEISFKGGN